jgi:hypothetical protein
VSDFCWEVINVYGSVKKELKSSFLQELYQKIQGSQGPLMVGGYFNMIRYPHEKSSGADYTVWMDMFNSFIYDTVLIELIRGGSRFTWTNKQDNPIRSNLDRVLVNRAWEQHFPKVRVRTLTRIFSDHNLILVGDGGDDVKIKRGCIFDAAWLSNEEFKKQLKEE